MFFSFKNPTFAHSPVRFSAVAGLAITRRDSQVGSANLEMIMIMRRSMIIIIMIMRTIIVMMMVVNMSERQATQVSQANLKMIMNVMVAEN